MQVHDKKSCTVNRLTIRYQGRVKCIILIHTTNLPIKCYLPYCLCNFIRNLCHCHKQKEYFTEPSKMVQWCRIIVDLVICQLWASSNAKSKSQNNHIEEEVDKPRPVWFTDTMLSQACLANQYTSLWHLACQKVLWLILGSQKHSVYLEIVNVGHSNYPHLQETCVIYCACALPAHTCTYTVNATCNGLTV